MPNPNQTDIVDYSYFFQDNYGDQENIFDLKFNFDEYNFTDLIGLIKFYPNKIFSFNFNFKNGRGICIGHGFDRQIYLQILKDMEKINLVKDNQLNLTNQFWQSVTNCKAFGRLIYLALICGAVLPFRLPVELIEMILKRKLNQSELLYFLWKRKPDVFKSIGSLNGLNDLNGEIETAGFSSKDLMLREALFGREINGEINKKFKAIASNIIFLFHPNAETIDYILSDTYQLTPQMVINMTVIDSKFEDLWKNFVLSLNEEELKQLLLQFTNSLATNQVISIYVAEIIIDLKISTCTKTVYLNKKLFDNKETLNNLRVYFGDSVMDGINDEINDNNSQPLSRQETVDAGRARLRHTREMLGLSYISNISDINVGSRMIPTDPHIDFLYALNHFLLNGFNNQRHRSRPRQQYVNVSDTSISPGLECIREILMSNHNSLDNRGNNRNYLRNYLRNNLHSAPSPRLNPDLSLNIPLMNLLLELVTDENDRERLSNCIRARQIAYSNDLSNSTNKIDEILDLD